MSEFINTIDVLGDNAVTDGIIDRSIIEYNDNGLTKVGDFAFYLCPTITSVNLPAVTSIGTYSFGSCNNLTKADFTALGSIASEPFRDCSKLDTLIIRNTARVPALLASNPLRNTPIASGKGYIYIPAALVDGYEANSMWNVYASQFRALEDYTDDGTTTGEFVIPFSETDFSQGYSVEWDYSQSSSALTRTGLAASFSDPAPATSLTAAGSSPFDNVMPWAGMKKYNIIDGEVAYSEDDAGFSMTDYDTMVYIPEFYYAAWKDEANSKWRWSISPTPKAGYRLHPGSGRYISRYHISGDSSAVYSKSGVSQLKTSRSDHRTHSHNKGENWWMIDMATWSALQLLYLVEFADFNSQNKLGKDGGTSSNLTLGGSDAAIYHTYNGGSTINQYRWVEHPFGVVPIRVDGCILMNNAVYLGTNNSLYNDTIENLKPTGITLPSGNAFITGFGYSKNFPWAFLVDAASGGSDTTYITDSIIANTSGIAEIVAGSGFMSSTKYGMFYTATNDITSNSNGSRLIFIP